MGRDETEVSVPETNPMILVPPTTLAIETSIWSMPATPFAAVLHLQNDILNVYVGDDGCVVAGSTKALCTMYLGISLMEARFVPTLDGRATHGN